VAPLGKWRQIFPELAGLGAAGLLAGAYMLHACLVRGINPAHASRALVPAATLVAVALLIDAFNPRRDHTLLLPVALLCGMSIALLFSIDGYLAAKQVIFVGVGCLMLAGTYLLIDDVEGLRSASGLAGLAAVLLLGATIFYGTEINGARLWLGIPGLFMFQSGELAKLFIVMFMAGFLSLYTERRARTGHDSSLAIILVVAVALALTMFVIQHDLGAGLLVFGVILLMIYVATGAWQATTAAVILLTIGIALALHFVPAAQQAGGAVLERRMSAWVNPWRDPMDSGYQTIQALIAMAHGGVFGTGAGLSTASTLPVAESDMIYAVASQEMGFVGGVALFLLYGLLAYRGFQLATVCRTTYSSLLATGLSGLLSLQALVIVGGVLKALPLTGVTLPFLSYGGSSMLVSFVAIGLLLCISRDSVAWRSSGAGGGA
jgi:cell division protein FtsW (lipid II flippase)